MASIASQLVFHPLVSQSLKLGGTTLGRDKLYRALQYFARFFAWYLEFRGDKLSATRWIALKSHLAGARKLLRLGKPLEHLQAALRASLAPGPAAEQLTAIGRQLSYAGYLTLDAFIWANTIKLIALKPETSTRVSKTSNRFWLVGILLSMANTAVKTARLHKEVKHLRSTKSWGEKDLGEEADREVKLNKLAAAREAVRAQLSLDALDVWLPASALGLVNLNDGVLGIFGFITSILALQKQWAALKLK